MDLFYYTPILLRRMRRVAVMERAVLQMGVVSSFPVLSVALMEEHFTQECFVNQLVALFLRVMVAHSSTVASITIQRQSNLMEVSPALIILRLLPEAILELLYSTVQLASVVRVLPQIAVDRRTPLLPLEETVIGSLEELQYLVGLRIHLDALNGMLLEDNALYIPGETTQMAVPRIFCLAFSVGIAEEIVIMK